MRYLTLALTLAAFTPLTAQAGKLRPADRSTAIAIDVVADGAVVCVFASATLVAEGTGCATDPALTNMDDTCPTADGWCGFSGSDIIIEGGQGDDTLTLSASPLTPNTDPIKLKGKAGDDNLVLTSAAGGDLHLYGEQGTDSYGIGTEADPIVVGEDARLIIGGDTNDDSDGETYAVHLITEGQVQLRGTRADDVFLMTGVVFADNQSSRWTTRAKGGDDIITVGPLDVEGTGIFGGVRATFSVLAGGGDDRVELAGALHIGLHASGQFQMGSNNDTIDLSGAAVTMAGYGDDEPTQRERQDSAALSLTGNRGHDTLVGSNGISMAGGATLRTSGWASEN